MSKNPFDDTPESFGHFYADIDQRVSSRILEDDPFSASFVVPVGQSAKDIVRYMLAVQQEVLRETILDTLAYPILIRGAKGCLNDYSPELIYRAIKLSVQWCNHPFSFKFVRERAIPEVKKQCPQITMTSSLTTAEKSQTKKKSVKK